MIEMLEMVPCKSLTEQQLVNKLAEYDKNMKAFKTEAEIIKAELQARGLEILDDRNIKTTEWYGNNNASVIVTKAQSMEIMNYEALEKIFGKRLLEDKMIRTQEVKYDIKSDFKQALISIFSNDYIKNMTLEEMLKNEFPELKSRQITLLCKKLKGDYKKDKEILKSVVNRDDLDEELFFIYKIKNYEKIKAYLPDEKESEIIEAVKRYVRVDENAKIALKTDKGIGGTNE